MSRWLPAVQFESDHEDPGEQASLQGGGDERSRAVLSIDSSLAAADDMQ